MSNNLPTRPPHTARTEVRCVRFYTTSRGNCFMAELAQAFVDGFVRLGLSASLVVDAVPPLNPPAGEMGVVVAPHEYFPLFLLRQTPPAEWRAACAAAWCLATEQPGSRHFEAGYRFAALCRGVFDINRQGVAEFQRRGIVAVYTPLGYTAAAEAPDRGEARDIDVLFLGHDSPKRAAFLARHAEVLAKLRCRLILPDPQRPRLATTPGFVSGADRSRLLRRSRILLNIHSADRNYFEWQRAIDAIANRCLFVSETSDGAEPLADGEHLLFAPLDRLMDRCQEYLADEPRRSRLTERAYQFVRNEFPVEAGCRQMLQAGEQRPPAPDAAGRLIGTANARLRSAHFLLRNLPGSLGPYLRRSPLAHRLFYPARSLFDRARGQWSLSETERRRNAILQRLDDVQAQRLDADRKDCQVQPNAAYRAVAAPAVTVAVSLYNYARYVGPCLESVERSESVPGGYEVVVVDDASTDDSAEVVGRFLDRSPMAACLVRKTTNTGLADARNLGLRLARGRRVFMLDADNLVYPQCLVKLAAAFDHAGTAAAYGILRRFDSRSGAGVGLMSCFAWDVARLVASPYLDAMAMFDRDALLAVGGYSTELLRYGWFGWEDYDMWLKLAQAGKRVEFCPEIVAQYRVHGSSMIQATSHYKPRLVRYFREKFADLAQRYPSSPRQFGWAGPRRPERLVAGNDE